MATRIMLVCAAGMSTSLLVTKMEVAAKEAGEEVVISHSEKGRRAHFQWWN